MTNQASENAETMNDFEYDPDSRSFGESGGSRKIIGKILKKNSLIIIIGIFAISVFFSLQPTGLMVLRIGDGQYLPNQTINGTFMISLAPGEFMPKDILVQAVLGNTSSSMKLEDIIEDYGYGVSEAFGEFDFMNITGNGTGYGVSNGTEIFPLITVLLNVSYAQNISIRIPYNATANATNTSIIEVINETMMNQTVTIEVNRTVNITFEIPVNETDNITEVNETIVTVNETIIEERPANVSVNITTNETYEAVIELFNITYIEESVSELIAAGLRKTSPFTHTFNGTVSGLSFKIIVGEAEGNNTFNETMINVSYDEESLYISTDLSVIEYAGTGLNISVPLEDFNLTAPEAPGDYEFNIRLIFENQTLSSETRTIQVRQPSIDSDGDGDPNPSDCAPSNPEVFNGAAEACNNQDDDCDGEADDGFDADSDGFKPCSEPVGDCDDMNETINPNATEICGNNIDEDCNGKDLVCNAPPVWQTVPDQSWANNTRQWLNLNDYISDPDGDELRVTASQAESFRIFVKDNVAFFVPDPWFIGEREVFFTADDGINRSISNTFKLTVYPEKLNCTDSDGDSYNSSVGCGPVDCDDLNETIHPNSTEICDNLIDEDCDGEDLNCTLPASYEITEMKTQRVTLGQPVRWVKKVKLENLTNQTEINIDSNAMNLSLSGIENDSRVSVNQSRIKVRQKGEVRGLDEYEAEKRIREIDREIGLRRAGKQLKQEVRDEEITRLEEEKSTLTGRLSQKGFDFLGWLYSFFSGLFGSFTGFAVQNTAQENTTLENETVIIIEEEMRDFEIEYLTPPPLSIEISPEPSNKTVIITSDVHYENILAFANLPLETQNKDIQLFWITNDTKIPINFTGLDTNSNSLIDFIEWDVPSLSNETYEITITILNVQSYPMVGGKWTVMFETTGQANLTITAINGTTWTDYADTGYDLKFLEVKCGDVALAYSWLGTGCSVSGQCSVFVEDYTCNETGYEISRVLTTGAHTLEFRFGNMTAYAKNIASSLNVSNAGNNNTNEMLTFIANFSNSTGNLIQTGSIMWQVNRSQQTNPYGITFADMDNDGNRNELVVPYYRGWNANGVNVYWGNGSFKGNITTLNSLGSNPLQALPADFDSDGYFNEVLIGLSGNGLHIMNESIVMAYSNTTFNTTAPGGAAIGDFDRDGQDDDFAISFRIAETFWKNIYAMNNNGATWLKKWSFDRTNSLSSGGVVFEVETADIDNDGNDDVVFIDQGGGHLFAINNSGTLIFNTTDLGATYGLALADIDHDGYKDDVIVGEDGDIYVFRFNGSYNVEYKSTNAISTSSLPTGFVYEIEVLDYDGDGYQDDFAATDSGAWNTNLVDVFMFDNDSTKIWNYSIKANGAGYDFMYNLVISDINNDGYEEIIVTENDYFNVIILNKTGTKMWNYTFKNTVGYDRGDSTGVELADVDLDNQTEIGIASIEGTAYVFRTTPCSMKFNDTLKEFSMRYNATSNRYEFNRTFNTSDTYEYNISCNGTIMEYTDQAMSGKIVIADSGCSLNVTNCTAGCLYIKNNTGINVAVFDKFGNLDIRGSLTESSIGSPDGDDLIVKNVTGTNTAWIDGASGNMRLSGTKATAQGGYCTPPNGAFVVRDTSGNCVSYIDEAGNLWLKGSVCESAPMT